MNLPPISNDYNSSIQTVLQDEIEKADKQNFKLDKDNFLTSSSISSVVNDRTGAYHFIKHCRIILSKSN